MYTKGRGEVEGLGGWDWRTRYWYAYETDDERAATVGQGALPSALRWPNLEGNPKQRGRIRMYVCMCVYICIADSLCCTVETITTLESNCRRHLVIKLCPTLCDPMACSPPGSSVHGISQVRILEWDAISFSRDLPNLRIEPMSPAWQVDSILLCYLGSPKLLYPIKIHFKKDKK